MLRNSLQICIPLQLDEIEVALDAVFQRVVDTEGVGYSSCFPRLKLFIRLEIDASAGPLCPRFDSEEVVVVLRQARLTPARLYDALILSG